LAAPLVVASAAEKVVQAVSNDIVVLEGKVYRTVKIGRKKVLEPVDVQLHVNPVGIGAGILATAIGLFAADVAWNGIHFGLPGLEFDIIKGLKESPYWQAVVGKLTTKKPLNIGAGYLAPTQEKKKLNTPSGQPITTTVTHTQGGDLAQVPGDLVSPTFGPGPILVRVEGDQVVGIVSPIAAIPEFR
jgi:hypothetical protein